ncbi:hypothetical protein [Pedobacter namyangjuensis]|uniref:hypothetical protein n=1 Tax=Pedobacter namyangjuensis TaxID=600626 RepID=UPI0013B36DAB|nr:hypothetical protein [Pedobacter namyangjuensis]
METAIQDQGRANVLFEAKGYGGTEQFNIEAAIGLLEDAMLGILGGSVAIDPENAIVADLAEDLKDATLVLNQQIENGLFNGAEG